MEKLMMFFLFLIVVLLLIIALFLRKVVVKILAEDAAKKKESQNYLNSRIKKGVSSNIVKKLIPGLDWAALRFYLF